MGYINFAVPNVDSFEKGKVRFYKGKIYELNLHTNEMFVVTDEQNEQIYLCLDDDDFCYFIHFPTNKLAMFKE
jgi:hypothetical protein